jgi:hypothetical protein
MLNKGEKQINKASKKYNYQYEPVKNVNESDIKAAIEIIKEYSESTIRKVAAGSRRNERVAKVLRELVIARQGAYTTVERINTEE